MYSLPVLCAILFGCFAQISGLRDDALCDIVAATNINTFVDYSKWSCTNGIPDTDPCTNGWQGLGCSGSDVTYMAFFAALTGKYV